jgi:2-oxoglutarate dehydrogenase E2 component (dihydrolipoamide succinyltransferase)
MATNILFPETGESIRTGVLTSWTRHEGEWVERDETIAEIETDKITVEVPAPASGLMSSLKVAEGDEIEVGSIIGVIDESADRPGDANGQAKSGGDSAKSDVDGAMAKRATPEASDAPRVPVDNGPAKGADEVRATPLARKVAEEHGIDLSTVHGTGAGNRIREQDVMEAVKAAKGTKAPDGAAPKTSKPALPTGSRASHREKLSPLRQRVAARLVEAQHTAAMLTTFNECDMSQVMTLRKRYKETFEKEHGIGLGFMSFFVKASVAALRAFPQANAYIVEDESGGLGVEHHDYCDVAIAVASPKGLVVPVVRNADALGFAEIEQSIKELATKAQDGKLSLEEMQGGTFTITNGGVFGSLNSTPILNPPQSAILGMHAIKNRPIEDPANPGQIVLRPMMYLALSYDHRLIDGAQAVRFLVKVKEAIEDPQRLLLDL